MRAVWMVILAWVAVGCAGGYQVGIGPYATTEGEVGAVAQLSVAVGFGFDEHVMLETAGVAAGPAFDANQGALLVHAGLGYAYLDKPLAIQASADVGLYGPFDRQGYDPSFLAGASIALWDGRELNKRSSGGKGVSFKSRTVSGFGGKLQGYWLEGTDPATDPDGRGGKRRDHSALFALLATWQGYGMFGL